jgi:DNA invertase Pin-like site-specific DNA recombinase
MGADTKGLRFGALRRVSTERQEKKSESLVVQTKSIERAVEKTGGTIVEWYGGQEHATEGWERKEVDRLIADVDKGELDAVIVAYEDRLTRDGKKCQQLLEAFSKHRTRLFVGVWEVPLRNPQGEFQIEVNAVIGKLIAAMQNKKSIETKIERASKGWPACGSLPFGRTFDRETGKWHIIPEDRDMIADCAARYLKGERLEDLATEYHRDRANLTRILRERCGETWLQEFNYPRFDIAEKIVTVVPRLLDEDIIKKLRHRLTACRTYLRLPPRSVHDWLLRGRVFCACCGMTLIGQAVKGMRGKRLPRRYYRHIRRTGHDRQCPLRPRPNIPADAIEAAVVGQLASVLGNPATLLRSIRASVPDCDDALKRKARLEADVAKIGKSRDRVLSLVADGVVRVEQARKQLGDLNDRESLVKEELERLTATLADVPDEKEVERWTGWLGDGNTFDVADKRTLLAAVFDNPLADGSPAGVYVHVEGADVAPGWQLPRHGTFSLPDGRKAKKKWRFTIRGRLDFECVMRGLSSAP